MTEISFEKEINKKLIEFAKRHKKFKAVFKGTSPEYPYEGCKIAYYFLLEKIRDDKFEDKVTDLDLNLHNTFLSRTMTIDLVVLPIDEKDVSDYGFIERCIYRRAI